MTGAHPGTPYCYLVVGTLLLPLVPALGRKGGGGGGRLGSSALISLVRYWKMPIRRSWANKVQRASSRYLIVCKMISNSQ